MDIKAESELLADRIEGVIGACLEPLKGDLTRTQLKHIRHLALFKLLDNAKRIEEVWVPDQVLDDAKQVEEVWVPNQHFTVGQVKTVGFNGSICPCYYIDEHTLGLGGTLWEIISIRFEKVDKRNEGKGIEHGMWFMVEDTGEAQWHRKAKPTTPRADPTAAELLDMGEPLVVPGPFHIGQWIRLADGTQVRWVDETHVSVSERDDIWKVWQVLSVEKGKNITFKVKD